MTRTPRQAPPRTTAEAAAAGRAPKNPRRSGNPAVRSQAKASASPTATWRDWVGGARVRTLPMALAPVLVGTGGAAVAAGPAGPDWLLSALCFIVALFLQVGVNYANDYSDGVRGTDDVRVGPARLVGGGLATPRAVLTVAIAFFAAAGAAGVAVTILSGLWWLPVVGAAAIAAAWFYTGGRRPYGYLALGEVFVFLFFGLVATVGTAYVQVRVVNQETLLGAVGVGLIACAAITVNNLRDVSQDRTAGKRTLSVLVGPVWSRVLFCVELLVPFALLGVIALLYPVAWFGLFALLIALPACIIAVVGRTPAELILVLKLVGLVQLCYGAAIAAGLLLR